jgi:hypothetical protein
MDGALTLRRDAGRVKDLGPLVNGHSALVEQGRQASWPNGRRSAPMINGSVIIAHGLKWLRFVVDDDASVGRVVGRSIRPRGAPAELTHSHSADGEQRAVDRCYVLKELEVRTASARELAWTPPTSWDGRRAKSTTRQLQTPTMQRGRRARHVQTSNRQRSMTRNSSQ